MLNRGRELIIPQFLGELTETRRGIIDDDSCDS